MEETTATTTRHHSYGGKTFVVPALTAEGGLVLLPQQRRLDNSPEGDAARLAAVAGKVRAPPRPSSPPASAPRGEEDGEGRRCAPRPHWLAPAEVLAGLGNVWDVNEFESVHRPLVVGTVEEAAARRAFDEPGAFGVQRVLDMPIKFPGSHEYRLPAQLKALCPLLRKVADFEYEVSGDEVLDRYCYLTLDQGVVPAGSMQRNEGCHTDGFQGARIAPKLPSDRSYVCSNTLPTVFYLQPFEVAHLDTAKHNFFLDFDRQAREENTWRPEPFEIVLMDAFSVHRGEKATTDTFRTFVRLSYTVRVFDRLGNAHNPMFDYAWEMVPRDTQSTLITYDPRSPPPTPSSPSSSSSSSLLSISPDPASCQRES